MYLLFLSTPSARRATFPVRTLACTVAYFYPRPPRGGRHYSVHFPVPEGDFYPRPPRGGRHKSVHGLSCVLPISIHALREEGDPQLRGAETHRAISIHALREEGDQQGQGTERHAGNFYPRPPRGGRLFCVPEEIRAHSISIHALREEGDRELERSVGGYIQISIHALREEGDS